MNRTERFLAVGEVGAGMNTTKWLLVAGLLVGGIIIGLIASRIVHTLLGRESRPQPLRDAAKPLATLAFWAGVIGGLIAALGILQPDALVELPRDAVAYLPKVISAAIIIILAKVIASFVMAALGPALARASASVQRQMATLVQAVIMGLAALLAVNQLGIDTSVINLGVAAIFFGTAASLTLLVGLGGREVASQVAATRVVRRLVSEGDRVELEDIAGIVMAVHPTAIELSDDEGQVVLVPSSRLVSETVTVVRVAD